MPGMGKAITMVIVGYDFDTYATYSAWLVDGTLELLQISERPRKKTFIDRISNERPPKRTVWPEGSVAMWPEDAVWAAIEGYSGHYDKGGKLAYIFWDLVVSCRYWGATELILPPLSWKKHIGLPALAKKDEVKQRVCDLYPELPKDLRQDTYDAVGIATAAHRIIVPHAN